MKKVFDTEKFLNIIHYYPRLNKLQAALTSSYSQYVTFFNGLENLACDAIEILCELGELRCHFLRYYLSDFSAGRFPFEAVQELCQCLHHCYFDDIRYFKYAGFWVEGEMMDCYEFWIAFLQCIPIPQDLEWLSFEG